MQLESACKAAVGEYLDRHTLALVLEAVADGGVGDVGEKLLKLLEVHLGGQILATLGLRLLCPQLLVAQVPHHVYHQSSSLNLPAGQATQLLMGSPLLSLVSELSICWLSPAC